jgi:hypothetical protein
MLDSDRRWALVSTIGVAFACGVWAVAAWDALASTILGFLSAIFLVLSLIFLED